MEIVYYVATSLDGYIATEDGGVDWLSSYGGAGDYGYGEFYATVQAILMGSRTYEVSLELGPWMAEDKPSWVFTERDLPLAHPTVTLTADAPATVVDALEDRGLRRAWLLGGGALATSFRQAGLISEFRIFVMPVLLGGGVPLFVPGPPMQPLRFVESNQYQTGVVELRYARERTAE